MKGNIFYCHFLLQVDIYPITRVVDIPSNNLLSKHREESFDMKRLVCAKRVIILLFTKHIYKTNTKDYVGISCSIHWPFLCREQRISIKLERSSQTIDGINIES